MELALQRASRFRKMSLVLGRAPRLDTLMRLLAVDDARLVAATRESDADAYAAIGATPPVAAANLEPPRWSDLPTSRRAGEAAPRAPTGAVEGDT